MATHIRGPIEADQHECWTSDRTSMICVHAGKGGEDESQTGKLIAASYTSYDKHFGELAVKAAEADILGKLIDREEEFELLKAAIEQRLKNLQNPDASVFVGDNQKQTIESILSRWPESIPGDWAN